MPRAVAASTMWAVLGPKHSESTMARNRLTVPATSKGWLSMAAITRSRAACRAARPTLSSRVRMTTL